MAFSGPALRVGGGGGPFAASHLLGVCLNTALSVLLANGPPAPPTRSRGVLRPSLDDPEPSGARSAHPRRRSRRAVLAMEHGPASQAVAAARLARAHAAPGHVRAGHAHRAGLAGGGDDGEG